MFTFLREFEAQIKLGSKAKHVMEVQKILGVKSLTEMTSVQEFEVTPQDYQKWLKAIIEMASERQMSINKKIDFTDLAHDLLDNDPKLDALGGDRMLARRNIVNALWQAYQVNKAHNAVQDHVANTIAKAREEEEIANGLSGSENCEFSQTMNTAMGMEDEERASRRNPYRPGTLRAALWNERHAKNGFQDEEFDDEGYHDQGGEPKEPMDTDTMSVDQLASHIMGREDGTDDADLTGDEFDDRDGTDDVDGDLESRVDDLESRVADLEGDEDSDRVPPDMDSDPDMDSEVEVEDDLPPDDMGASRQSRMRTDIDDSTMEEDEQVSDPVHMAITSPKEHMAAALKAVEDEGYASFLRMALPNNPHPKKSPAFHAWAKGLKAGAKEAFGINDKPRQPTSKQRRRR